jgi:hypothetical protein
MYILLLSVFCSLPACWQAEGLRNKIFISRWYVNECFNDGLFHANKLSCHKKSIQVLQRKKMRMENGAATPQTKAFIHAI